MNRDPVCGMQVDSSQTQHHTMYQGKEYSFCSSDCKQTFDKNPQRYATTRESQEEHVSSKR